MAQRHVLLTRFNLATAGREAPFRNAPGWLEGRFALFERYCLPTVAAQTTQHFSWIVYFDDATPEWARQRIEHARSVRTFFPYYTPPFDEGGWARSVRKVVGVPRPGAALITSNLDNDDALATDYVSRVQAAAAAFDGDRFAVNLANGLVLAGRRELYAHRHPYNAFTNMVEPDTDAIRTTMSIRHMDLPRHLPIVQDEGPAGWLQIVHETNVSNRIRGRRADRAEASGRFPDEIVTDIVEPGWIGRYADRVAIAPFRALRDRAFELARRVIRVDRAP